MPPRWLPLLLLAGCTATSPAPGPQACTIEKSAEIPVSLERGFVSAPAEIEDKPVTLLIDTGSETSLVTPSAMAALRLQPDPHRRTTLEGTGGAITTQNALLPSFGIGGMEMLDQSTAVGRLPNPQSTAVNAYGLLGADWLRDFDVEFDLPHRRMALYRVQGCGNDDVSWSGQKVSIPAQIYRSGLIILSVELDGQPITAILDSGAATTLLSETAAARIGVGSSPLDRSGASIGIDGTPLTMRQHRFAQLRIGTISYPAPLINISSVHLPMADMLLGADWLRGNRVWISYETHRITIQPNG